MGPYSRETKEAAIYFNFYNAKPYWNGEDEAGGEINRFGLALVAVLSKPIVPKPHAHSRCQY
jgi:hypothetical protein